MMKNNMDADYFLLYYNFICVTVTRDFQNSIKVNFVESHNQIKQQIYVK